MKSKLLLLLFFMLLTIATSYAQITTSPSGIAVQGIARDNNNTARTSATLNLTFRFYYGSNIEIYEVSKSVVTDAFGVFSVVLEPGSANNILIANNDTFLKISEGATIISDEKLKQVPYAIAASNGVPTGSIMPYIGTTAPQGWVLCDGRSLSSISGSAALIALVGSSAPNLQGMFLRGTGTSSVNSQAGPALKATQNEDFKSHLHNDGTLRTDTTGDHSHSTGNIPNGAEGYVAAFNDSNEVFKWGNTGSVTSSTAGSHSHDVTGNTGSTGGLETRPVNYGVNYIIKL